MENEKPEVTDKTYTLSSANSYFNTEKINLNILLPVEDTQNPYEYTVFDVSQDIQGEKFNALFVYLKKQTDNGDDLSGGDDDTNECVCLTFTDNIQRLTDLPDIAPFDAEYANDALVIVYHDTLTDSEEITACAVAAYTHVKDATTAVRLNGNFQGNLSLMGGQPKKAGMSIIPKG